MMRIIVAFRFIFILVVSGIVHGDFPNNENADSTQIVPSQTITSFNQFNAASSYPVFFTSQPLTSPSLSQASTATATNTQLFTNTNAASGIQSSTLNNGYINSFASSVASNNPSSVTSASTTSNTVVSGGAGRVLTSAGSVATSAGSVPTSAGSVSLIKNTNGVSGNEYIVESPSVDALAQSFAQSLSSLPAIKSFLEVPVPASEISDIFYAKSVKLLGEYGHSDPHRIATIISDPVKSFDVFTFPLLFESIGKSLAQFLIYEGVEITPNISQLFASYVEKYLESYNVSNVDSLIEAVWYGGSNFITSLGFNLVDKSDYLTQVFFNELTALKN